MLDRMQRAEEALLAVFEDSTLAPDETIERLQDLKGQIEDFLIQLQEQSGEESEE